MILYYWQNTQKQQFSQRYNNLDEQVLGRDIFARLAELLPTDSLELGDIILNFDAIVYRYSINTVSFKFVDVPHPCPR